MANCTFCQDIVGMPYTCKLCGNKFCSKHRLPENHSCSNIGIYSTPEYKRAKVMKEIEIKEAKGITSSTSSSYASDRKSIWSTTWSTGNQTGDIAIFALLLSLVILIKYPVLELFILNFLYAFLAGITIFQVRKRISSEYGITTRFIISPVGIAFTFILGIIGSRWILIGWFNDDEGDIRDKARIGLYTIGTMVSFVLLSYVISLFLPFIVTSEFNTALFININLSISLVGSRILWLSLMLYLPWRKLDGIYIFQWNRNRYFLGLIGLIILVIVFG